MVRCDIPPGGKDCDDPLCEHLMKCKHSVICEICEYEDMCVHQNRCREFEHQLERTD